MTLFLLILLSPFWTTYLIISLLFDIYKNKASIISWFYKLYNNKTVKSWVAMIADLVFNASAGLFTIVLGFIGLSFAVDMGLLTNVSVKAFIDYDYGVIFFMALYAIIMATISWYVKNEIKGKQ